MTCPPAAILLAAGRSSRMGSCKPLLPLGGGTVIDRCLETLLAAGIGETVVVVSVDGRDVASAAARYPVHVAINPDRQGDMASSVRAGQAALASGSAGIIVALCDCPLVLPATVMRLRSEHERFPGSIIVPCHQGRKGHPLLIPRSVLEELAAGMTLRDLLQTWNDRVRCVEVDDPGILLDMDTPEDYRRISGMVRTQAGAGGVK